MLDKILAAIEPREAPRGRPRTTKALVRFGPGSHRTAKPFAADKSTGEELVDPVTMRRSSRRCFRVPNNDVFRAVRVDLRGRGRLARWIRPIAAGIVRSFGKD